MKFNFIAFAFIFLLFGSGCQNKETTSSASAETLGSVLPFPEPPTASITGESLAESKHQRRLRQNHLPADAPNIIIVLMDDVGFGTPSTFGGEINTPTLSRVAAQGISYNAFHTTAICSPTRASLLTGRNHTRVGNGQ
jgi:hypothetical protein